MKTPESLTVYDIQGIKIPKEDVLSDKPLDIKSWNSVFGAMNLLPSGYLA